MASENNYVHSSSLTSKTETEAGKGAFAYSALVKGMKYSIVCYYCIPKPGHSAAVPFDSGHTAPDHKASILAIFPGFARKVALSACTARQRARTVRWVSNVPAVAVASLGEEGSSCVQYPPLFRRHHRSCIFTTRCSGPKQEFGDKWVACAGRGVSL